MTHPDVTARVKVYEQDDGEWGADSPPLTLVSHWNDPSFAVLELDGHRYTFSIEAMRAALVAVGVGR